MRQLPWSELMPEGTTVPAFNRAFAKAIRRGDRPTIPPEFASRPDSRLFVFLLHQAWDEDPTRRPLVRALEDGLVGLADELADALHAETPL